MADVKKIRLPNGTDLTIKDSRITGVDNAPTSGSSNVVTSSGVFAALAEKGSAPFFVTDETTVEELRAAIQANRPTWFLWGNPDTSYTLIPYMGYNQEDGYCFGASIPGEGGTGRITCSDSGVWNASFQEMELTDNKVTSLSSSSTDIQYPSAKAVYDALALKKEAYFIPVYQDPEDEEIYHVDSSVTYATMLAAANAGKLFFVGLDADGATGYVPATYVVENDTISVFGLFGALGAVAFIAIGADTENDPSVLFGSVSIPNSLSDLDDDTNHRLVTDTEKATWNAKYDKPSTGIPASDLAAGVIPSIDPTPTSGSSNPVSSGGVYNALDDKVASTTIENIVELTQVEFDALTEKDPTKIYIVTDPSSAPEGYVSIADVDVQPSLQPGGQNVTTITLTNGQEIEIITYNGTNGTSGIIPVATTVPAGGMLPNVFYDLGALSGNTTFSFDTTNLDSSIMNHWFWTFETPSTAPTITWPAAITSWKGGAAPTIAGSSHYEISVIDGVATFMEV